MDNWSAWKNWKADAIEQLHGNIVLQVARGPKPGISAEGECNCNHHHRTSIYIGKFKRYL